MAPRAAQAATVVEMADQLRVRCHHEVDSSRSRAGLPDLIPVGPRLPEEED